MTSYLPGRAASLPVMVAPAARCGPGTSRNQAAAPASAAPAGALPFTMPAGSAFQVLRYQAPVRWAVINGHSARFGFTIPGTAPAALAGLPIVVKVHDGGPGFMNDTYAHGVATSWHNGPVTQYPITSGNISVHRR